MQTVAGTPSSAQPRSSRWSPQHARAGAVCASREWIEEYLSPFQRNTGPICAPFNAWTVMKGLETLPLRAPAQSLNGTCALADSVLCCQAPDRPAGLLPRELGPSST